MGREKRKTRLDKASGQAGTTEFLGFGAFAAATDADAGAHSSTTTAAAAHQSGGAPCWSPVYAGRDERFSALFARIGQKRDATTVTKALGELQRLLCADEVHRRIQAEALHHWAWLYHTKLAYDVSSAVRAASLRTWLVAYDRIPRAVKAVATRSPPDEGSGACELLGMMYSCQTDPAGEVRATADPQQPLYQQTTDWPWREGLLSYTRRVLEYGRASAMHDALFARKNERAADLNEQGRDALEERFERITGNCLQALEQWIRHHPHDNETVQPADAAVWWKTLKSPKHSLRRKTYQLLCTAASKAPHLIPPDMNSKLLPAAVSSEKEAANMPALLETVLACTVRDPATGTAACLLTQPVSKLLKKACYGARVDQWGPTLLPLMAHSADPLTLLQAVNAGLSVTLGDLDRWNLTTALAECASFCLLRKSNADATTTLSEETAQKIASLWLRALSAVLSSPDGAATWSPAAAARKKLLQDLAKQTVQFGDATYLRPSCAFTLAHDWFWTEGLHFGGDTQPSFLAQFIHEVEKQPSKSEGASPLIPNLCDYFWTTVLQYQNSGAVPSEDAYLVFQAVFRFCGPVTVFDRGEEEATLEKFVMNDLLRWTIVHTSTLSTQPQSHELVEHDFRFLSSCLAAVPEKRHGLWESLLREILAAKCSLDWLGSGLRVLLQQNGNNVDWMKVETLNKFAAEVSQTEIDEPFNPAPSEMIEIAEEEGSPLTHDVDDTYRILLEFYRTCSGAGSDNVSLVSHDVVTQWIERACPSESTAYESGPSPLLEALSDLVRTKQSLLNTDEVDRVLLEGWRREGRLHDEYSSEVLEKDDDLRKRFMSKASAELREDLTDLLSTSPSSLIIVARSWAMKAYRVLQLYRECSGAAPSFQLVGLGHIDSWRSHPEKMFLLSVSIFEHIEDASDRLALVTSASGGLELLENILVTLSEASSDPVVAVRVRQRRDRCATFLEALGGKSLDKNLIEQLIKTLVSDMTRNFEEKDDGLDEQDLRRHVAVLSQLVDLLFLRVVPCAAYHLREDEISEGDQICYVTDSDKPSSQELARIVKVHRDDVAGVYFTIRVDRDGRERQTIAKRLRRQLLSRNDEIPEESVEADEWSRRSQMRDMLMREVIEPQFSFSCPSASLGELVNVVVTQISLGKQRGVGSPHHHFFRLVNSFMDHMCSCLSSKDEKKAADLLWAVSLSLGFGLNTPSSNWILRQVQCPIIPSYKEIISYYDGNLMGSSEHLDRAVLVWFATSCAEAMASRSEETTPVIVGFVSLAFQLASRAVAVTDDRGEFDGDAMIASLAIYHGINLCSTLRVEGLANIGEELTDQLSQTKTNSCFSLVNAFGLGWKDRVLAQGDGLSYGTYSSSEPHLIQCSSFPLLFSLAKRNGSVMESLAEASGSENAGPLSDALFDSAKRYFAYLFLEGLAKRGTPVQEGDDVSLADDTSRRLQIWSENLEEEEAAEIQEDVYIVAEWVPKRVMSEIESWAEEDFDDIDEATTVGRLLNWLIFLHFVDATVPKDFRIRPAFVSYLGRCGAVSSILNLVLLNSEALHNQNRRTTSISFDPNCMIEDESSLEVSRLSLVVFFRTVEVLPSLSRRWWEEDCPRVSSNAVQGFVEKHVAPEILRQELDRIKSATTFGPMSVTASLVSREVTATYVQDDFTLKVLISLPAAFPFRSAVVDCSKTLGVPQSRWKRWNLQITLMLNNQGGTLQDALMLWKDNVDKEFEGVEPCPVCYSVLHVKTHKLPSLECKTCQNRFHVDCLTQWFRSSGKSNCVICQQPWHGTRLQ